MTTLFASACCAVLAAAVAACVGTQRTDGANPGVDSDTIEGTYDRRVFTDTVYLSDFATHAAAGLGGGVTYALPPVLSFVKCDFRGPVLLSRGLRDRVVGGELALTESTLAAGCDLRGLALAHGLGLYGAYAGDVVRLDGVRVGGGLDIRRATFAHEVRLPSVSVATLLADHAHFEGGLSLQRACFREGASLVEAEVDGYLDGSYLVSHGGLFFEHIKVHDRASFDYAEVRGRWSFNGAVMPAASFRYARAARGAEAFPEGIAEAALEGSSL